MLAPLSHYAENIFVLGSNWHIKRNQKGRGVINKVVDNNNYLVRNFIIPFWGEIPAGNLSPRMINEKLLNAQSRRGIDITYSTKNKILSCLSEIYRHLIEEEILSENPVKKVMRFSSKITNPRGALTPEEMQKLFPAAHDKLVSIYRKQIYVCAFLVLKDTGLRPNELIALQWQDWYPEIRFFPIVKAIEAATRNKIKNTKTGSVKPAMVSAQTAQELARFKRASNASPERFIFSCQNNLPVGIHTLSRNFQQAVKRAGLNRPEVTPYWLRHTFNTRALEKFDEEIVRRLMGHSTQQMTRHYRDADVFSLIREAQKIRALMEAA